MRRNRTIGMLTAVVLAAVATLAVTQIGLAGEGGQPNPSLLGAWTVRITEGSGTPELPDWYGAHLTVSPGGGLVATIADPNIRTGHGSWARVGPRSFAVTILLLQFAPSGDFLGTLKARATLTLDRQSRRFESRNYRFDFFDENGDPTGFTGVGRAHGARIRVER